ncbi:MAG: SDR family oxidoreductase [Cyanobacteria bacterium J06554_6]
MGYSESPNSQKSTAVKHVINNSPPRLASQRSRLRLAGKVALLMSGGGRIDRKIASVYAQQGASIVLCGLDFGRGTKVSDQLKAAGGKARFVLTDVSNPDDVKMAVDETVATYGRLDILINHCQVLTQQDAAVQTLRPQVWDRMIEVALRGTFLSVQQALPFLIRSDSGSVINIAPTPQLPGGLATAVSRSSLLTMTEAMSRSLAGYAIRVNLIWPEAATSPEPPQTTPAIGLPRRSTYVMTRSDSCPNRAIARAALYLACEDSQALNGSAIRVRAPIPIHVHRTAAAS